MAHFTNYAALEDLKQTDPNEFGRVSRKIWEYFIDFCAQAERTGKRNIDQWAQIPNEAGQTGITAILGWTSYLCSKAVFDFCRNFNFYFLNQFGIRSFSTSLSKRKIDFFRYLQMFIRQK